MMNKKLLSVFLLFFLFILPVQAGDINDGEVGFFEHASGPAYLPTESAPDLGSSGRPMGDIYAGTLNISGIAVSGGVDITIADTVNDTALAVVCNDVTNNPDCATFTNTTTSTTIFVDANGNNAFGNTSAAIGIENTGNTGSAFRSYSNIGATADLPLNVFEADNAGFDQSVALFQQDGPATNVELDSNGGGDGIELVWGLNNTTGATHEGIAIDFTRLGNVAAGTDTNYGIRVSPTVTGASAGTINTYGVYSDVTCDTGGTSSCYGGYFSAAGGDANVGLVVGAGGVDVTGASTFNAAVTFYGGLNVRDSGGLGIGNANDFTTLWNPNGTGDDHVIKKNIVNSANDSGAILYVRDVTPTNMTDHDDYFSPTPVWTNDQGADANDYSGMVQGWRGQNDVAATNYYDFYAMTGSFDGAVDGTTAELAPMFRFGNSGTATSNHSLGAGDVLIEDMLEVNGQSYFDGQLNMHNSIVMTALAAITGGSTQGGVVFNNTAGTPNTPTFLTGSNSNTFILAEFADNAIDWGNSLETNPTWRIQSADATDVTQYIQFNHNQANGVIDVGSGGLVVNATALLPDADDAYALGAVGTAYSDLFLADGSVLNFNNDITLTQSLNNLVFGGGNFTFSGAVHPPNSGVYALGVSNTKEWADLFLADTAVIGFNNGDMTLTHSANDLAVAGGSLTTSGRLLTSQGADVASANDITLGADGNYFDITGTTQINRIASAGWQAGAGFKLQFDGTVTVKDAQAAGGGFASILITGSADYVSAAGGILEGIYDGTSFKCWPVFAE